MKSGVKVFIKNEALGKFLFLLRDNDPNIPGPNCWSLVGGGIEENETPTEALEREVFEEINIPIFDLRLILQMTAEDKVNGKVFPVYRYIFSAKINASQDEITLTEGQKASFFTLEEIVNDEKVCPGLKKLIINNRATIDQANENKNFIADIAKSRSRMKLAGSR